MQVLLKLFIFGNEHSSYLSIHLPVAKLSRIVFFIAEEKLLFALTIDGGIRTHF